GPACNEIRITPPNFLKLAVADISIEFLALQVCLADVQPVHLRIDMPIRDEDVEQSVIIEICKVCPPTQVRKGNLAKTGRQCHVGEQHIAEILVQGICISCKIRDENIQISVAIVVACSDAHSGLCATRLVQSRACSDTDFRKRSVLVVSK